MRGVGRFRKATFYSTAENSMPFTMDYRERWRWSLWFPSYANRNLKIIISKQTCCLWRIMLLRKVGSKLPTYVNVCKVAVQPHTTQSLASFVTRYFKWRSYAGTQCSQSLRSRIANMATTIVSNPNMVVTRAPDPPGFYSYYASKSSFALGGIQIGVGVLTSLISVIILATFGSRGAMAGIVAHLIFGIIVSSQ